MHWLILDSRQPLPPPLLDIVYVLSVGESSKKGTCCEDGSERLHIVDCCWSLLLVAFSTLSERGLTRGRTTYGIQVQVDRQWHSGTSLAATGFLPCSTSTHAEERLLVACSRSVQTTAVTEERHSERVILISDYSPCRSCSLFPQRQRSLRLQDRTQRSCSASQQHYRPNSVYTSHSY